jgi:hypothetical protein
LLPEHIIMLPGTEMDSSWKIGLNLAVRDGLVFGKNFIFTYGPLGFLSTHVGLEMPFGNLWIFLFDFSLIGTILLIIHRILKEYNSLVVYGLVFLAIYHLAYAETTYKILVIVVFFLFQNIKKFSFYSLTLVVLFLVIQFFIKPSAAIYLIVIFLVTILYIAVYKRNMWVLVFPFALIFIIFFLSKFLKVDLSGYLNSTLELSTVYTSSMNRMNFTKLKAILSILFALSYVFTFLIISLITIFNSKHLDNIMFSGIVFLSFYFLFKQSYVRFDSNHLPVFWSTVLSLVCIFYYHTNQLSKSLIKFLYISVLIIFISAFSFVSKFAEVKYLIPLPVSYLNELFSPQVKNDYFKSNAEAMRLPEPILQILGKNSLDVIPHDIYSTYFNKLNYKPRPVIQSYAAVSTLLNTYNCNFFIGADAAEFILYSNGSIDNRYPFWDESMTKQVLISHYETIDSLFVWKGKRDTSFLLKKRINPLIYNVRLLNDTLIELNKKYSLPKSDNLIYLNAEIEYSYIGNLQNIFYQPPFIYIKLFFEDGGTGTYRLVVPEIRHGVIINKKLLTQSDAYSLFKYQGQKNENIISFVIQSDNKAYKSRFRIRLTEQSNLQ